MHRVRHYSGEDPISSLRSFFFVSVPIAASCFDPSPLNLYFSPPPSRRQTYAAAAAATCLLFFHGGQPLGGGTSSINALFLLLSPQRSAPLFPPRSPGRTHPADSNRPP